MRRLLLVAGVMLATISTVAPASAVSSPAASSARAWNARWDARWDRRFNRRWVRQHPPLNSAIASWYDDGGTHCCGFYAYYGVADCGYMGLCIPQGTRVEFVYGGRRIVATVDDHGPYANGASFDLNQNTAAALGFQGVGTVRYRVL